MPGCFYLPAVLTHAVFEFGAEAGGFGRDCHGFVARVEVGEDFGGEFRFLGDAGGEEDGEGEEGGDELFHGVVMVAGVFAYFYPSVQVLCRSYRLPCLMEEAGKSLFVLTLLFFLAARGIGR